MMINSLDRDYAPLELHSLGCVYTGLFYRREFMGGVVEVSLADFMCGVVNVFHNKYAIEEYVETKARDGGNNNGRENVDSAKEWKVQWRYTVRLMLSWPTWLLTSRNLQRGTGNNGALCWSYRQVQSPGSSCLLIEVMILGKEPTREGDG